MLDLEGGVSNIVVTLDKKTTQQELQEYEHLVKKLAHKYRVYGMDIEDLEQELRIVLWNCLKNFDTTKNTKFTSYFISAVIWRVSRLRKNIKNSIRTEEMAMYIHASDEDVAQQATYQNVIELLSNIPNGHLVYEHYIMGYSKRQLAKMYARSSETITNYINKALETLKKTLNT